MAPSGRKKLSRRQRKRAGLGRDWVRSKPDDVVAHAIRRSPEIAKATGYGSRPASAPRPLATAQSDALGDLTYVRGDIRRIAILAVVMFLLLGIVVVVWR